MPRKSAAKAEEPSSDEASAHSDVEMQDQHDDKMSGFKKFGVSATRPWASTLLHIAHTATWLEAQPHFARCTG